MNRTSHKNHQSHSPNGIKDVEPKVEYNPKLQRARFYGVSMRRQPSFERSSVLSANHTKNNNINQQQYKNYSANNQSRQVTLSAQKLSPSSLSFKQSNSINNSFIKGTTDSSIRLENNRNKKESCSSRRKIFLCTIISLLIILIIVLSTVLPLRIANSKTTSSPNQFITSQNLACTSNSLICSTPIFHWNYYCNPMTYNYYSCCYLSPISTQLTIEFQLQEDISHWSIDDISATQNNGELITNGGFELGLNGWILTIPSNATLATYVQNQISSAHTGSAYLYGGSQNAAAYLKQTFNVIQGQNINISFWWADQGSSVYIPGKICQANVKIT